MLRVIPNLREDERRALLILAERERRDPREQAALIIRRELERAGLLKPEPLAAADGQPPRELAPAGAA